MVKEIGRRGCKMGSRRPITSSLKHQTEESVCRLRPGLVFNFSRYIIAAGGAGSSGLPALASGRRISKNPSKAITTTPKM